MILFSIVFNLIMFPLIRLHYKKPLWVWPISAALACLVVWVRDTAGQVNGKDEPYGLAICDGLAHEEFRGA
jgi:hypothetical protein